MITASIITGDGTETWLEQAYFGAFHICEKCGTVR